MSNALRMIVCSGAIMAFVGCGESEDTNSSQADAADMGGSAIMDATPLMFDDAGMAGQGGTESLQSRVD